MSVRRLNATRSSISPGTRSARGATKDAACGDDPFAPTQTGSERKGPVWAGSLWCGSADWTSTMVAALIRSDRAIAFSIAAALAATRAAFGRSDSPMLANARALAPAVICSICELDADSVRNSTAASGLTSSPPSALAMDASKRVSALAASAASVATSRETLTSSVAICGGTEAEYGPRLRRRSRLDICRALSDDGEPLDLL